MSDSCHAGRMEIRPATPADLPGVVAIENAAIADGVAHFGTEPVTLSEASAALAGPHPFVVAVDDHVRGFARSGPWKTRAAYAWTVELGVYVAEAARGRGVGRALYASILSALESAGYRTVLAGIVLPNPASVALHESFGFMHAGTFERNGFKRGAWHDVGYWALHLGDGVPRGR